MKPTLAQLVSFLRFLVLASAGKALGLFQGFLVVWLLDVSQYGYYAAVIAMATTVASMGNAGIGMFISAFGGRHHGDVVRMGSVARAAASVQNVLLAFCGVLVLIAMPLQYLALDLGSWWTLVMLTVLGAATMAVSVRNMMQYEILRICLRLELVQAIDCVLVGLRIAAIVALHVAGMLDAVWLVAANLVISLLALGVQQRYLRPLAQPGARAEQIDNDRRDAWRIVLPQLPNAIYTAFQGQIPYWLMSVLTTVTTVAEFTVLGRLGLLFGFLFDVVSGYFIPRVGRCQDPQRLGRMIVQILSTFYLVEVLILVVAYFFRHQLLWLLGPQYAHLDAQLVLILCSMGVASVSASLHAINSSRAWLAHSWSFIVLTVITQALSLLVLDVSTLNGLLWFSLLPHFPFILVNILFMMRGLAHFRLSAPPSGNVP